MKKPPEPKIDLCPTYGALCRITVTPLTKTSVGYHCVPIAEEMLKESISYLEMFHNHISYIIKKQCDVCEFIEKARTILGKEGR